MDESTWPIIIASWGDAKLLRFEDDHYELQGGTTGDWAHALKWIEAYMPEVAAQLRKQQ